MFDADNFTETLERPSIRIDGELYTGKLLSFRQMLPYAKRFTELDPTDSEALEALAREVFEAMDLPADKILELPVAAVMEALGDFFASHSRRTGAVSPPGMKTTS